MIFSKSQNNFNVLRLLAALQVAFLHAVHFLEIKNSFILAIASVVKYFPGVPVFFILSGFLVVQSYERNIDKSLNYFKNRFLRIYPALLLCSLISLVVLVCVEFDLVTELGLYTWFVSQLTFFQFFTPDSLRFYGVGTPNGVLWTVSVEVQFYLLLPLLVRYMKQNKGLIVIIGLGSLIFNYTVGPQLYTDVLLFKLIKVALPTYLYLFILGVLIHWNWDRLKGLIVGKLWIWLPLFVIYCLLNSWFWNLPILDYWMNSIQDVLFVVLLAGFVFSFGFSTKLLDYLKIFTRFDYSYGIYIYHMIVINLFIHLGYTGKLQDLGYMLGLTLFLAVLSWHWVEKKALSLK